MTTTPVKLQDLDEILSQQQGSFTKLNKITVPFTTIVNRAQCVDPSTDHLPKFGVNRVEIQQIEEVQGESGPNGERVWKLINDQMDQVRLVGSWTINNDTRGLFAQASVAADFIEITFYGTGLNVLVDATQAPSFIAGIDGGSTGGVLGIAGASLLHARNYATNQVINITSGLTLGVHTVKIVCNTASGMLLYGFEVLNTNSTLQYVSGSSYVGGKKVSNSALATDAYNSTFESGTLNSTYGGHVVVYQKSDGTIKKAVQSNSGGALYQSSANHANESVIRTYSWREFGASRSDDFSLLNSSTSRTAAFVLDDGVTALMMDNGNTISYNGTDGLRPASSGTNFITFSFVGTGLDLLIDTDGNATRTFNLVVDGGSTITGTVPTTNGPQIMKVVSGLPYGTHTVKYISTNASASPPAICRFIVYGPAKPTVPANAVELCDYYLMGSYAYAAIDSTALVRSSGVLTKNCTREMVYAGSWGIGIGLTTGLGTGFYAGTGSGSDTVQYTFFGTGFELDGSVNSNQSIWTIQIASNGGALANLGTSGTQQASGGSYNSSTSQFTNTSGATWRFSVSGLALALYTVKMTLSASSTSTNNDLLNFNVITPIHSPKGNLPGDLQNTQIVGSCALGDSRNFPAQKVKSLANWAQAIGISSNPTTTSTSMIPMQDMACVIKTSGNPIEIFCSVDFYNSATENHFFQFYVDGVAVGTERVVWTGVANSDWGFADSLTIPVAAGVHIIQLYWSVGGATATLRNNARTLKVWEKT